MENSTFTDCVDGDPSAVEFFNTLQQKHQMFLFLPITFCFMTLAVYVINLKRELENGPRDTKANVAALVTIYPVRIFVAIFFIIVKFFLH